MKQISDKYSVSFYPFASEDEPDVVLASMGFVNIVTNTLLAVEQKVDDKVIFNIQIHALTRSEWDQFKAVVETAFEMQAVINSRKL